MAGYVVASAVIQAKMSDGSYRHVYQGAPVPDDIDSDHLDQLRNDDMIVKGDELPSAVANADDITTVERPAGNASTEAWHDYAVSQGKTPADLEGLSRDDIRDLFPDE